ncbi:MAG: hypothetical protein ACYDCK_05235 [Thermoplasmatota archaeon]
MVEFESWLTGIYPRSEELVAATRDLDRGRAGALAVGEQQNDDAKRLIQLELDSDLTAVSDGLVGWQDIFRPFLEHAVGLSVGPLTRNFDNNNFYRRPIVRGAVRLDAPFFVPPAAGKRGAQESSVGRSVGSYFHHDAIPEGVPRLAVLPSPYWFAKAADDRYYHDTRALTRALAKALNVQLVGLRDHGVSVVVFLEPYAAVHGLDETETALFADAIGIATDGVTGVRSFVHTYFGDGAPLVKALAGVPSIEGVGVDFFETNLEDVDASGRTLVAGAIAGRNSLLEAPTRIAEFARRAAESTNAEKFVLTNASDLELVPQKIAEKKVQVIGRAARIAGGT